MKYADAATTTQMGLTENGMPTYLASGNPLVDLFSAIGSSRGKDLRELFTKAYYEADRVKALKILLWARDIRGGAGQRQTVRNLLLHLETLNPNDVAMLIPHLPVFGRWDDLLIFETEHLRRIAFQRIAEGLIDPSTAALVAKWLPRKGKVALQLEEYLGLRPVAKNFTQTKGYPGKAYRQLLTTLTNVVEQQMCAREWDLIEFGHLPSVAAARYQKAFNRRCAERYSLYKTKLQRGEAKINASAVYPYDVIKSIEKGDAEVAKAQWEVLPDFLGDELILAMVDVSGSMLAPVASNVSRLDVSTSLGLYIADKSKGPFKDCFMTFSGSPKIEVLKGDILYKHAQMCRAHWEMNTNLHGAFMEILRVGQEHRVTDADMPKILLILSDMEFDSCVTNSNETAMIMARRMYEQAGYTMPKIVYWNLAARIANTPVQYRENDTALVSGFSPAIMKAILRAEDFSPVGVMEQTIGQPRYNVIDVQHRWPRTMELG